MARARTHRSAPRTLIVEQIVFAGPPDLYHKSPDSGELLDTIVQEKLKGRFDDTLISQNVFID